MEQQFWCRKKINTNDLMKRRLITLHPFQNPIKKEKTLKSTCLSSNNCYYPLQHRNAAEPAQRPACLHRHSFIVFGWGWVRVGVKLEVGEVSITPTCTPTLVPFMPLPFSLSPVKVSTKDSDFMSFPQTTMEVCVFLNAPRNTCNSNRWEKYKREENWFAGVF